MDRSMGRGAAALVLVLAATASAEEPPGRAGVPAVAEWLVVERADRVGRRPFGPNAVFRRYLLARDSAAPVAGELLAGELGQEVAWRRAEVDAEGRVDAAGKAWGHAVVGSPARRVVMAEIEGAAVLFVNGTGFAGDVYGYGSAGVPVELRAGRNDVYVAGLRGGFRLVLREPAGALEADTREATLPDLVVGEAPGAWEGAVRVVNATSAPTGPISLDPAGGGPLTAFGSAPGLPPLGTTRLPFRLGGDPRGAPGRIEVGGRLFAGEATCDVVLPIEVREPGEPRRRTFRSAVDESVQYYAERPPVPRDGGPANVLLTLHGAGVEALGQVRAYSGHPGLWIVAPTNRRPFGFDWQDWGRRDAYEALAAAQRRNGVDPSRPVLLTGHSMGGHGTWHLAANDPGRFGAIAPSAGWASFDTYGGRPDGALAPLWRGADGASLTFDLIDNLASLPVYVLHGSADDNVPVAEAERMLAALRAAGAEPQVHVEDGAGHWWDGDAAPGADCVDWPPLFEFLRAHSEPPAEPPARLALLSADPGVDATHHWLTAQQPLEPGRPIRVRAERDAATGTIEITTQNARRLAVTAPARRVVVDGAALAPDAAPFGLLREGGAWRLVPPAVPAAEKGPHRTGPFKRAFDRAFVLVAGTAGNDVEDRELLERARFDSQQWEYRANGTARVVLDRELLAGLDGPFAACNVVLYGNADTNAAWDAVFEEDCPVRATRGAVRLRGETFRGDALGCVFVHRRRGSPDALAAAFADTGPAGTRLGYVLAPFTSGVGYPDYAVFGPEVLTQGDGGVLAAGWFDAGWR